MRSDSAEASGARAALPRVHGYTLHARVYLGARAAVYRGFQDATGRAVVVKLHRDDFPTERQLAAQRRAHELGRRVLSAPNVIQHLALESLENDLALVMEDNGGLSLDRWLRAHGRPSLVDALRFAWGTAEGLAQLHAAGIVHKDVKPANVVVDGAGDQVKLIDLGIASTLRSESASSTEDRAEGTLRYMSPEQTGRMNRPVDARSDLYGLGATLFHLLTGRPPFLSDDPLELVHAHIAVDAPEVRDLAPDVPVTVSAITARLLRKRAEDRYQTAVGVAADLRRCLDAAREGKPDVRFTLGERDRRDHFLVSDSLYGREDEQAALLGALDRVSAGEVEVVLVSGRSGIGKSALVHEVEPGIAAAHGRFASGKFDLYRRDLPYLAWIGALQDLIRQALSLPEARLASLRGRLQEALGPNGAVISDVVADLELILGPQPPLPVVSPGEAVARFGHVFRRFLGAFLSPTEPFAIFLDDLQWADLPSLSLMEVLATDRDARGLLLIGAFREEEVGPTHPLRATLHRLATAGRPATTLALGPLSVGSVEALVADSVHTERAEARPLAELIHDRTGGNPFFVHQLLERLALDGVIRFDAAATRWTWDLDAAVMRGVTDDVAKLMTQRFARLSDATCGLLQIAACLGASFDLDTLAAVSDRPASDTARDLEPALAEGLVLPLDGSYRYAAEEAELAGRRGGRLQVSPRYRFLHDRVEQAAHDALAEGTRAEIHLRLGRMLLARGVDALGEQVIDVASHLGEALGLLKDPAERLQAAEVFLMAARRAKACMATGAAARYLRDGLSVLPSDAWSTAHDLALGLHTEAADVAYIEERWDDVERHAPEVLRHAANLHQRMPIHLIRIGVGVSQLRYKEGTHLAVDVLRDEFAIRLPKDPITPHVLGGVIRLKLALRGRDPKTLIDLPTLTDPDVSAALGIMMKSATNAYWGVPNLVPLLAFRMIRLSLQHGNTGLSAYGYALYGMIASAALGLVDEGYAFGQLAMDLLEKTGDRHLVGKTGLLFHGFIRHHRDPYRKCAAEVLACYTDAMDAGDVENAAYCATVAYVTDLLSGRSLGWMAERYGDYVPVVLGSKQAQTAYALRIWTIALARLTDRETTDARLVGDGLDFDVRLQELLAVGAGEGQAIAQGCGAAGWLAFVMGDDDRALAALTLLHAHREAAPGQTFVTFGAAMLGVVLARRAATVSRAQRRLLGRVRKQVRGAADRNPDLLPFVQWMDAEADASAARTEWALRGLADAASSAKAIGNLWVEAMVSRRLAELHAGLQHTDLARFHQDRARSLWRRFGASALDRHGEGELYEEDFQDVSGGASTFAATDAESLGALDVRVLLAAVRAISSEIEMDRLLERVLRVALQAAGARRGLLYLRQGEDSPDVEVVAEATIQGAELVVRTGGAQLDVASPDSIVAYVRRTKRHRLIDDAGFDELFANDAYVRANHVRSVVCVPLMSHGSVAGVLYLENDRGAGVFTEGHVSVLQAIGGQGVVAVENARLFAAQRRAAEAFGRFVPRPFLAHIGRRRIEDVALGDGVEAEVSVLFSDLRGFTALSEHLTVSGNFALINDYLARMLPAVNAHGGFVDKFIGDAVMALFVGEADGAVRAAVGMHRALEQFNDERAARGEPRLNMGVGVHTGTVMLGTIGSNERMETTVIGDAVNLASRLEGMTKHYGASLLISDATRARLRDPEVFALREVGRVRVKGRRGAIGVHEVLDARTPDERAALLSTRARLGGAFQRWVEADFASAITEFEACAAAAPFDVVAQTLARRASELARGVTPVGWDGVDEQHEK